MVRSGRANAPERSPAVASDKSRSLGCSVWEPSSSGDRRLSRDRHADANYTLIWDEPDQVVGSIPTGGSGEQPLTCGNAGQGLFGSGGRAIRWPHGSARHRRRSPLRRTPRRLSARGRHPVRAPVGLAPLGNAAGCCVATWTCEVSTVRRRSDRCVRSEMLHAAVGSDGSAGRDRLVRWRTTGAWTRGRRPPGSRVLRRGGAGWPSGLRRWRRRRGRRERPRRGMHRRSRRAWVLTANQTIVPTSSLASATAPASRSATASCCPSAATILATKAYGSDAGVDMRDSP